jgi:hypothetical protein
MPIKTDDEDDEAYTARDGAEPNDDLTMMCIRMEP